MSNVPPSITYLCAADSVDEKRVARKDEMSEGMGEREQIRKGLRSSEEIGG